MGNALSDLYQTNVVPRLYQQYYWGLTSGWMENNAVGVEYNGGKYVRMCELTTDGLGDYDQQLGYPRGNITGSKKEYELTKDRGREFLIDAREYDETGFMVTAGAAMAVFQRDHVIPEVDSYRYSKIYSTVATKKATNVIADNIVKGNITDTLIDDIAAIRDKVGSIPLVIIMSGLVQKYFGRDFTRSLDVVNFMSGNVKLQVNAVNGNPFLIVPSDRLKTAYTFRDGVSAGQEAGGYAAAAGAKDMKWIITPVTGPVAVGKIDKMRAFSPDEYQAANAWKVDYRIFHDLWMFPNAYNNTIIRVGDIVAS